MMSRQCLEQERPYKRLLNMQRKKVIKIQS